MAAMTIEYQMGCGGRDIARTLAEKLGFSYMDREIVQGVANELHIQEDNVEWHDERVAGLVERTPVSYTHLDVYKRQVAGRLNVRVAPP